MSLIRETIDPKTILSSRDIEIQTGYYDPLKKENRPIRTFSPADYDPYEKVVDIRESSKDIEDIPLDPRPFLLQKNCRN